MSFGIELFQFHSFGVNRHTSAFQHQFIFGYSLWWPSLSTLELEAIYLFVVSSIRPFYRYLHTDQTNVNLNFLEETTNSDTGITKL